MQQVLAGYAQQGVVGVRFQFDMNGQWSAPFVSQTGALSPSWQNSFSLFLQDVRAANIRYVSITPDWFTYGLGNMTIYGCVGGSRGAYTYNLTSTCTSANANAVFYPWLLGPTAIAHPMWTAVMAPSPTVNKETSSKRSK